MGCRVVINQSNYLPWKGYFDLIHDADLFIFLDDVQFTKNDWRNRNRVKGPNGTHWLTIPVGQALDRRVDEVPLPGGPWREKHWRALQHSYRSSPHFARFEAFFREVYSGGPWRTLSELNQHLIKSIARDFLGLATGFVDSSAFQLASRNQDRVIDLLKAAGATTYISGPAARSYLDPARFEKEGIELVWKDYAGYPEYPQPWPPFEHAVAIVDLLFSVGPAAPDLIWGWRNHSSR
jgi:hypothetical protein